MDICITSTNRTTTWLGAVCSLRGHHPVDLSTHGFQENRNVALAEGFSEWAQNALRAELWGIPLNRPYNRRTLAVDPDNRLFGLDILRLTTLEMVQRSDQGVDSVLRLLHTAVGVGRLVRRQTLSRPQAGRPR